MNSYLLLYFQRFYEISGSDSQLVSTVIAPMKSVTVSFKLDLQAPGWLQPSASSCHISQHPISKLNANVALAHDAVHRSQSNPANLHQQISLPAMYNQISSTDKKQKFRKGKKKHTWNSEIMEERHKLIPRLVAVFWTVGKEGLLGFGFIAVTDLLNDLGNVFVPCWPSVAALKCLASLIIVS